ncbi:DNA polymerase III subunit epsilon [Fulvitalea axinellae]|uniref:DNA polymerase III subunit epsilon n=1 Tax=Fulvitalea axinellae TaxID=1182444 RepID=A0AAU9CLC1_9BACT|nr:DNA polymerase III subunit epsilon [Fulvitalea axinellae]
MNLKLKKPLVFFDLETTGTNISHDKIVEYAFIKVMPNGDTVEKVSLVNPRIPIPEESSMIHGIRYEDIKDAPTFADVAQELSQFLGGCDLAGFNIIRFDAPVLVEEFTRVGMEFDVSDRKLVDAQKIFHMMEKRNLSAAYKFYCGKKLEGAHGALADTQATLEVLCAQIERYEGQEAEDLQGNVVGIMENNVDRLHKISLNKMVDLAGRLALNDNQVEIFNFGKHKGKPVLDVFDEEPGYYDWMMRGDFPLDTKRKLTDIKLKAFNQNRR